MRRDIAIFAEGMIMILLFAGVGLASAAMVTVNENGEHTIALEGSGSSLAKAGDMSFLWKNETGQAYSVDISNDGNYVVAGSGKNVYLFDKTGDLKWNKSVGDYVYSVAISSDGNYVVVGSGNSVYYFDKYENRLWKHDTTDLISSVTVSDDGNNVAFTSYDGYVYYFNKNCFLWQYETTNPPSTVSMSGGGGEIAVGCYEWVYYFDTFGFVWDYEIDGLDSSEISISDDGEYVAIAGGWGSSYYFDKDKNILWEFDPEHRGNSVKVSSDGEYVVLGSGSHGGGNGWVYYFSKDSNIPIWENKTFQCVGSVDISSDGEYVVAGSHPTWTLYYFNNTGDLLFDYPIWVESAKMSGDGKFIVATSWDNYIYFFGSANDNPPYIRYRLIDYVHDALEQGINLKSEEEYPVTVDILVNGDIKETVELPSGGSDTVYVQLNEGRNTITASSEGYTIFSVDVVALNFTINNDAYWFKNTDFTKQYTFWTDATFKSYLIDLGVNPIYALVIGPILYWHITKDGNCYGMSSTAILYHDHHELKPGDENEIVRDMDKDIAAPNIKAYQAEQVNHAMEWFLKFVIGYDQKDIYNEIVTSIENEKKPVVFCFSGAYDAKTATFLRQFCGDGIAHAVVAYKVYEEGDDRTVVAYDNNEPDSAVNSFKFDFSASTNDMVFTAPQAYPPDSASGEYMIASSTTYPPVLIPLIGKKLIDDFIRYILSNWKIISLECPVNATITDQYGRVISDDGINEIPNAGVATGGDAKVFFVPPDLTYTVDIKAYDSGNFTLTQLAHLTNEYSSVISFTNISVNSNTKASVIIDPTEVHDLKIDNDGDGTTDEVKEPDVDEKIGTCSIQIHTGWNLISIPLVPGDINTASVLPPISGNYSIIWEYNASDTTDHWKKYEPSAPFGNDLTEMEPGKGYWILMTSDNTLSITGTVPELTDIDLKTGWNLIGYNSLDSQPITDARSSITGNYDIIWEYNASDTIDHWKKYDPNAPFGNDLTDMEPGKGYWILMNSDDTLEI